MAVIGAKGNFGGPGGAFEEGRRKEIVCNEVRIIGYRYISDKGWLSWLSFGSVHVLRQRAWGGV